jgi:hypothetical protein
MLGFKDFWKKKKKNDKNFYITKDDKGFPLWVIKPPFPIEVEPEDKEPTPENDVPTKVSDYISSKKIR